MLPEPVRYLNPPAEGAFLAPFFISIPLQTAPLADPPSHFGYFPSFSVIRFNLFFFWRN